MAVLTKDFDEHISGDTFLGANFVLSNELGPIPLTGAKIELVTSFGDKLLSTEDDSILITNAATGEFEIPEQIIDWPPEVYYYKIKITFLSGRKRTYVKGKLPVI